MEKCRGRVLWLWDQLLKKQMKASRIRSSTDLYRVTGFYQGKEECKVFLLKKKMASK